MLCLGHFDEEFAHTAHGKHGANNKKKKVNNIIILFLWMHYQSWAIGTGKESHWALKT